MSDSVGKYLPCQSMALLVSMTDTCWAKNSDRVFVHALNTVKRIPRTGSARPPEADRLKLYGLYKQSMEGDVEDVMRRPDGNKQEEITEREKWYCN